MTAQIILPRARLSLPSDPSSLSPIDRLTLVYVAFTTGVVLAHLAGWRNGGLPRQLGGTMLLANGLLLVPVAGILVAVVYLQIHYAIDAIAGLGMAGIASILAPRLCPIAAPETEAE